jgi:hypothetical protein
MKTNLTALAVCAVLLAVFGTLAVVAEPLGSGGDLSAGAGKAFDQFGYNDKARIFNGPADGVDRALDGAVWGDPVYANDRLVMKWNAAWDACNDNGYDDPVYCAGAWVDNEWNGAFPGGSGSVWHYKIVWVGSAGEASPYWQPGGYSVWGNYEVLMDQGVDFATSPVHTWITRSAPNGYGSAKK